MSLTRPAVVTVKPPPNVNPSMKPVPLISLIVPVPDDFKEPKERKRAPHNSFSIPRGPWNNHLENKTRKLPINMSNIPSNKLFSYLQDLN